MRTEACLISDRVFFLSRFRVLNPHGSLISERKCEIPPRRKHATCVLARSRTRRGFASKPIRKALDVAPPSREPLHLAPPIPRTHPKNERTVGVQCLNKDQRSFLEATVRTARDVSEEATRKALRMLAVEQRE